LRRPASLLVLSAIFLAAVGLPAEADAKGATKDAAKRVAVTSADGGGKAEGPVRAQIAKVLKKNKIKVIPQKKGGAPADDEGWIALGKKLKVDGFVQLSFEGGHGKQSVEVSVRTGADGTVVGSETFSAKGAPAKLGATVGRGFWKLLGASVKQVSAAKAGESGGMPPRDLAHEPEASPTPKTEASDSGSKEPGEDKSATPAAEPAATPEKTAAEENANKEEEPPKPIAKPARPSHVAEEGNSAPASKESSIIVSVQGRYLARSFYYTPTGAAPVNTSASPTVGAEAMWFPITNFGIEVGGEFESWLKIISRFPSTSADVHASLVFRQPLSFGDLYVHAGGFRHFFAVVDDGTGVRQNLGLPDTVYLGARGGGGVRVRLTDALSLTGDVDYRLVTSLSGGSFPITSPLYFPRATAGPSFDAAVSLSFRITPMFDVQVGGDIRRYVLNTKGQAGDRINASGATDQYLAGWVALGGAFGGH
jgi:hypothetical protein